MCRPGFEIQLIDPLPHYVLSSGLGIGTTPTALAAHGVRTTVVEIDPAVDILARRHFDLPDQVESVIEDAADFVESAVGRGHKYDYIVHDVFTGGAEPVELFTTEFFYRLRSLLEEEGVIAIVRSPFPPVCLFHVHEMDLH